jgi:hypothetical protein
LLTHDLELEFHAAPDAPQVNAHHTVLVSAWRVGDFCKNILNASIVIGGIQLAELSQGLLHHSFNLRIVRHVTSDDQRLVTFVGASSFAATFTSFSLQSASTTDAPASANAFAVARPKPDAAPVTRATLFSNAMFIFSPEFC